MAGCMQSLAHYKQQLLSLHQNSITQSEAQKLESQVREHLTQLEEIDSLRRHRYRDLLKCKRRRILIFTCAGLLNPPKLVNAY